MDSKQALKLYVVLSKACRAASEAGKMEIRKYGLSQSEFAVLDILYHKGPQPVQQIAGKILLTSGSMTYVVSQLEKKGLVRRVICEDDRRIFLVKLTEAGDARISEIFPAYEKFIYHIFCGLQDEDPEILISQLKLLGKSITEGST